MTEIATYMNPKEVLRFVWKLRKEGFDAWATYEDNLTTLHVRRRT